MKLPLFGGPRDGDTLDVEDVRILEEVGGAWLIVPMDPRPFQPLHEQGYVFSGRYRDDHGGYYRPAP